MTLAQAIKNLDKAAKDLKKAKDDWDASEKRYRDLFRRVMATPRELWGTAAYRQLGDQAFAAQGDTIKKRKAFEKAFKAYVKALMDYFNALFR